MTQAALLAILAVPAALLLLAPGACADLVAGPDPIDLPGLDCVSVGLDPLGVNPHPDCLSPAVGASVPASMRTPPLP